MPKYKHNENVIESDPTEFKQIFVPAADEQEYVTDDGLVIPSITLELHRQLFGTADRLGISWERRVSIFFNKNSSYCQGLENNSHIFFGTFRSSCLEERDLS